MRANGQRGGDGPRASLGGRPRVRPAGRRRLGMGGSMGTGSARGALGAPRTRCGLARACAFPLGRYGFRWPRRGHRTATRPGLVPHATSPEASDDGQRGVNGGRNHGRAPSSWWNGEPLYRILGSVELPAANWYTTLSKTWRKFALFYEKSGLVGLLSSLCGLQMRATRLS
jgi:hypothetical protein